MGEGVHKAGPEARRSWWAENVQWPWSRTGWRTDELTAERDAELDDLVDKSSRGVPTPYGREATRLTSGPLMNNPYFSIPQALLFAGVGLFTFDKLGQGIWAWLLMIFFVLVALAIAAFAIWRIPAWHRARNVAKAYVADHGGTLPAELRWYT